MENLFLNPSAIDELRSKENFFETSEVEKIRQSRR